MSETTYYHFNKPDSNTPLSVLVSYNGNLDLIDSTLKDIDNTADLASSTASAASSAAQSAETVASQAAQVAAAAQSAVASKPSIDDTAPSSSNTYSSSKIQELIGTGVIDDSQTSATTTFSSNKIVSEIAKVTTVNTYSLASGSWTVNSDIETSTDYPYIYTLASSRYTDTSSPIWQVNGVGTIITADEAEDAAKVTQAVFSSTGIVLYATEQVTENLVLAVKGVA